MSGVDRRGFLKALAAAATGTAAAPRVAGAADTAAAARVAWQKAPCTLCSVRCGLLVGIENGRAVAAKGDPDCPTGRGLACAKGYHAVQMLYGRDRLLRARVRRGGTLVEASLDSVLDTVAHRLRETIARHGSGSVALYGSDQWTDQDAAAATGFCHAIGTTWLDTESSLYAASATAGRLATFGADRAPASPDDFERADVFVLWNHNMAETDPVLFSRLLARRRTDPGVRIIDVTTRTARTSYAADRSILYTPGSELAILNALCAELVERRLIDRDFIAAQVAFRRGRTGLGGGLDGTVDDEPSAATFADFVRFLTAYTPERVQHATGIAAADLRWLASLYGDRSRRVLSLWGDGVNAHVRGTWVNNVLYNVHLLTGRIAEPGDAARCLTGASPVSTPPAHGALPLFRAVDDGAVRFLWIQSADPMLNLPNLRRYRRAASRDGVFIVVSDAYPTSTTDMADVVLPSALWIERPGSHANVHGRVQPLGPLVAPPGDARAEAWQMHEVARRAGQPVRAVTRQASPPQTVGESAPSAATTAAGHYAHDDQRAWIWLRPAEAAAERADARYPFTLLTGAVLEHAGAAALTRRIPALHRAVPHAYAEFNAADARELGVRSGDRVRLVSRRDALEIEARVDLRSQPPRGQLFVPRFDEALAVNLLTLDTCCPLSGQPDYGAAVRVERISAGVGS